MKLWDIVRKVGGTALQIALPSAGSIIVDAVNELLPKGKKLPEGATGDDINKAIDGLPPEQRASVMEKEFDVDIIQIQESNSTLRTMLESEAASPQSTRPKIAMGAFRVVSFISIAVVALWFYAVVKGDKELVKSVVDGWPLVGVLTVPFVGWLNHYFGILKTEQKNKLNAAAGNPVVSGVTGVLSKIINRK